MTRRRAIPRTTSPEWAERDSEWSGQAKSWMEDQAGMFFDMYADRPDFYTASDLLGWLDERPDLPVPYARFLSDYDLRYNWTSSLLDRFSRAGKVEVGSTVNARGKEARCYRKPRKLSYDVQVEGPNSEAIRTSILGWLQGAKDLGLDSLLITKAPGVVNDEVPSDDTTPEKRSSARRGKRSS